MGKRKATAEPAPAAEPRRTAEYTVLARRYRPQQFRDLVGQEHVAQALTNAIETNRVAHAYLFTGTRGVGKTSAARILAKALNCVRGPTPTPCDECDPCRAIAAGEDVDVIEIDGASNTGVDNIRDLRQNARVSPTARSRFKIYIIDEVHMLSKSAFNALLKTLEEPPGRVKFIFATTEVHKIPVTVLSRCQRFDFAGIAREKIIDQLAHIARDEGIDVDADALDLVARRAGGSMRDAQSLFDQLLSFGSGRLTAEQVHRLLGSAPDERVASLAAAVLAGDAATALDLAGRMADEGLQLGEVLDQLINYWRDLMVTGAAGPDARPLSVPPSGRQVLAEQAAATPLDTVLAGLDVLGAAKGRIRAGGASRVLLEAALVRLSRLRDLVPLAQLVERIGESDSTRVPPGPPARSSSASPARAAPAHRSASTPAPIPVREAPRAREPSAGSSAARPAAGPKKPESPAGLALTPETLPEVWQEVLELVGPIMRSNLEAAGAPAILGPNALALRFAPRYNLQREYCQDSARLSRIEEMLRRVTGQAWSLRIDPVSNEAAATSVPAASADKPPPRSRRQKAEALREPLVERAAEVLGAQIVAVDEGFGAVPPAPTGPPAAEEDA